MIGVFAVTAFCESDISINNIKLGTRLSAAFALILFLALAITALSLWRLESTAAVTRAMMSEPLAKERGSVNADCSARWLSEKKRGPLGSQE